MHTDKHKPRHTESCQDVGTVYPTSYRNAYNMLEHIIQHHNHGYLFSQQCIQYKKPIGWDKKMWTIDDLWSWNHTKGAQRSEEIRDSTILFVQNLRKHSLILNSKPL